MQRRPTSCDQSAQIDPAFAQIVEQIVTRIERGEPVDVGDLCASHPDHADRLQQLLPAMLTLASLRADGDSIVPDAVLARQLPCPQRTLGDFRILREVGRGGMGVVYEAQQVSLGRRVALKVLPFAGMLDPRHLVRFRNEAQVAAQLHHTNIVPVFYVGCERGVHFYAMQFIEGQTLGEVVGQLRRLAGHRGDGGGRADCAVDSAAAAWVATEPEGTRISAGPATAWPHDPQAASRGVTDRARMLSATGSTQTPEYFRSVARLGVQAAEALEHAHELGVIHRDIKPSNLLLDARGKLWITDFGLANVQNAPVTLTTTGDLIGTVRYMSPEQAMARRVAVDHRSDVYSLGATLYELLTLEPAFPGRDREEVLRRIAFEEPTTPHRINRAVPAELETVVLKCLEKNPADRYATARELAEDLQRFLADEPVRARRPSLALRAVKWGRRHRPVVWSAAVCLLVCITAAAASFGWIARDRQARMMMLREQTARAMQQVETLEAQGDWSAALQTARGAQQMAHLRDGAGDTSRQLDNIVDTLELVWRVEEIRADTRSQNAHQDMEFDFEGADRAYAQAFGGDGIPSHDFHRLIAHASPHARTAIAAALDDWATVRRVPHGRPGWQSLHAAAESIDPDPWRNRLRAALMSDDPQGLAQLARSAVVDQLPPSTLQLLGESLLFANRHELDELAYELLLEAQRRYPSHFWITFGLASAAGRLDHIGEAIRYCTAAVALRPQSFSVRITLGFFLKRAGRLNEALAQTEHAVRLIPDHAGARLNLGVMLQAQGRLEEAIVQYREAIRLQPHVVAARVNLAGIWKRLGHMDRAITELHEALEIDPRFATAHYAMGNALLDSGLHEDAVTAYREAIRIDPDRAVFHMNLGVALSEMGQFEHALTPLREAVRLMPIDAHRHEFAQLAPGHPHYNLGMALAKLGRFDEAIQQYHEALRLDANMAGAHDGLGRVLAARGSLNEAIAAYRQAIRIDPNDPAFHINLGNALANQRQFDEAIAAYGQAIDLAPDESKAHHNMGNALKDSGRPDEAIASYEQAIRLAPQSPNAHYGLAGALSLMQRWPEAEAAYRRALNLNPVAPVDAMAWRGLGVALERQSEFAQAVAAYRQSLSLDPDYIQQKGMERDNVGDHFHRFLLARACWELGHHDAARQWHAMAVQWMTDRHAWIEPGERESLERYRAQSAALMGIDNDAP